LDGLGFRVEGKEIVAGITTGPFVAISGQPPHIGDPGVRWFTDLAVFPAVHTAQLRGDAELFPVARVDQALWTNIDNNRLTGNRTNEEVRRVFLLATFGSSEAHCEWLFGHRAHRRIET
jgi:hypothetical protein